MMILGIILVLIPLATVLGLFAWEVGKVIRDRDWLDLLPLVGIVSIVTGLILMHIAKKGNP